MGTLDTKPPDELFVYSLIFRLLFNKCSKASVGYWKLHFKTNVRGLYCCIFKYFLLIFVCSTLRNVLHVKCVRNKIGLFFKKKSVAYICFISPDKMECESKIVK